MNNFYCAIYIYWHFDHKIQSVAGAITLHLKELNLLRQNLKGILQCFKNRTMLEREIYIKLNQFTLMWNSINRKFKQ